VDGSLTDHPEDFMLPAPLLDLATQVLDRAKARGVMIATAESCSSAVVERGFVTYSNEAKTEMLGVPAETIASVGAVSEAVARAMAEGALSKSRASLTVAVTGVAGPGGGSAEKPVGLVHFGCALAGAETVHRREVFAGDRSAVREATVRTALEMLLARLS
jgi:nicotinamide-nucleotide amidase